MDNNLQRELWPGWETVRLLGRGSFGAVYEIRREFLGMEERAALKTVSVPQGSGDIEELRGEGYDEESITGTFREYLKGILEEYALMRKLNGSANVVSCDDVRYVQHDDGYGWDIFIKMELLTPLTKALDRDIGEETVRQIGRDLCKALMLCRRYNIVHRDIKPANVFLSNNGDFKLGDFGIAKTVEKTSGGTRIGTYEYMAPEVYHDEPYGSSVDLYSLGLVLYWLLNERRTPFLPLPPEVPKVQTKELARKRRFAGEPLPPPKHGSPALKQIVLKACAYDPKDRYQTAEEMLEDLNALEPPAESGAVGETTGPAGSGESGEEGTVLRPVLPEESVDGTMVLSEESGDGTVVLSEEGGDGTVVLSEESVDGTMVLSEESGDGTMVLSEESGDGTMVLSEDGGEGTLPMTGLTGKPEPDKRDAARESVKTAARTKKPGGKGRLIALIGGIAAAAVLGIVLFRPKAPATVQSSGPKPAVTAAAAPAPTPVPAAKETEEYNVVIWLNGALVEQTMQQIEAFNKSNRSGLVFHATVEEVSEGDISVAVTRNPGASADLFVIPSDALGELVRKGAVDPLPADMANTASSANAKGTVLAASYDGRLYAYPLTADNGFFLYYDRSVIPQEDIGSMEAMIADCEAAGRSFCFELENTAWYSSAFFFGTGCVSEWELDGNGDPVALKDSFNSPEGLIAARGMKKLMESPAYENRSDTTAFAERAAVVVSGTWGAPAAQVILGANYGAAELPSFTVDGRSYHLRSFNGCKLMGVKNTNNAKRNAAMHQLAQYLCGEQCQKERFLQLGWGPSNLQVQKMEEVREDAALNALLAQAAYSVPQREIDGYWWSIAQELAYQIHAASGEADLQRALEQYSREVYARVK